MNSNLIVHNVHMLLWDERCVEDYKIKIDNKTQDVTLNVTFFDCKKRFVFPGGAGWAFSDKINKTFDKLMAIVEGKNESLKEAEHG